MCQLYVRWKRAFEHERAQCRPKPTKRHSGRKRDSTEMPGGAKGSKSRSPGRHRAASLAVPGQGGPSSPPPSNEAADKKSAIRSSSRKTPLQRSKTTELAQPVPGSAHVGFADTDEVRTIQNRSSLVSESGGTDSYNVDGLLSLEEADEDGLQGMD